MTKRDVKQLSNVSLFANVKNVEEEDNFPLELYLEEVKDGKWQDLVFPIRNEKNEEKKKKLKSNIPTITMSGVFSKRNDSSLVTHSGFINIDLDHVQELEATKLLLSQDKFVYSCFVSTGGDGLRVLFKINGAKHRESFLGISEYLLTNYGLVCDPQSVSVSKPFLVTFDPFIYIAQHNVPLFTKYPKEKEVKKILNFAYAEDDFQNILKEILVRNINIAEDYADWLKIGFAFASKFGEKGREYFHSISAVSSKYNSRRTDKQYDYCLRSDNLNIATISTFYYFAKLQGINIISERTSLIRKMTLNGKSSGLTKKQIAENLEKKYQIIEAEDVINQLYDTILDAGEDEESDLEQLELYISANYELQRNSITRFLEQAGKPMEQRDFNSIFIAAKKFIPRLHYDLVDRLLLSDFVPKYNPIHQYLEKLPEMEYTGESPLIDALAKTINNDDEAYTTYFIRKWIVGIISSAYGVHSPLMLALLGTKQGTGKTEWFRRLFPAGLRPYYAESKLDAGKDDDILMTQKLLIVDDEMGSKTMKEADRFKSVTSRQIITVREPYGRNNVDLMRLAVLGATSNKLTVLQDTTGNRRIIPIIVNKINHKLYNSIDKELLFAEALAMYKAHFEWEIKDEDDIKYLAKDSEEFEVIELEKELLISHFVPSENDDWLMTSEIKVILDKQTQQKLSLIKLGGHLEKFKFPHKTIRRNKQWTPKCWGVRQLKPQSNFDNTLPPF